MQEQGGELLLRKKIVLRASSQVIQVNYHLQNRGNGSCQFKLGVEFNLAFLAGYAVDRYYHIPGRNLEHPHLASRGIEEGVSELYIFDEWRKLAVLLRFSPPATLWRFPVETVSQSEGGLERIYQQSVIVPNWEMSLENRSGSELAIELAVNS